MRPVTLAILRLIFRLPLRIMRSGGAIVGLLLMGYIGLFAMQGDRGFSSLQHLNRKVTAAEQELAEVKAEREAMERRVVAMRPEGIDRDLLDESVRKQLGYVGSNEIVLLNH